MLKIGTNKRRPALDPELDLGTSPWILGWIQAPEIQARSQTVPSHVHVEEGK